MRLDDPQWDSDGRSLLWLEGRSDRSVLVGKPDGEAARDLTEELNPGGGGGYGGGDYTVAQGTVIFANRRDGRLYRRSLGYSAPYAITPPFGASAAPLLSPDGRWVIYVHSCERKDAIGLVDAQGVDRLQRTFGRRDVAPTSVLFGYAAEPESLESATAKAAWLDEAGQKRFRLASFEAILRRLSLAQGRVLLTTTPYDLGWLKQRLYSVPFKPELAALGNVVRSD